MTNEDMGEPPAAQLTTHPPVMPLNGPRVVVAGQAESSLGGNGAEATTGLTVDQHGMLYKVAVPPATFSPAGLPSMSEHDPCPSKTNKKQLT